jgi:hypothetical protein
VLTVGRIGRDEFYYFLLLFKNGITVNDASGGTLNTVDKTALLTNKKK